MRLELPAPPFDNVSLLDAFGFILPQTLVEALNVLCHDCVTAEDAYARIEQRLGWLLAGENQRYSATPPEMYPIAGTGSDGGHFGYIIHQPEKVERDYALARFEPMDSDPVRRVGRTTVEALSNTLSDTLFPTRQLEEQWPAPMHTDVSNRLAALGIVPARERSLSSAPEYGYCRGVPVETIPLGWRHVQSSDGVGVLAPTSAFDGTCAHQVIDRPNVDGLIAGAEAALSAGFPATALWHAREGLWRECHQPSDANIALSQAAIGAYRALGRFRLVSVVERRLLEVWKQRGVTRR